MKHHESSEVEFYAPFAHIEGRYEACRIHSTGYGSFDCVIVIEKTVSDPVSVYVAAESGRAFMADRFPRSACHPVDPARLTLSGEPGGRRVFCALQADAGPLRLLRLEFRAPEDARPTAVPYGGSDVPVWGGGFTCEGVDLALPATALGRIVRTDGTAEDIETPAILTLGSVGYLRRMQGTGDKASSP